MPHEIRCALESSALRKYLLLLHFHAGGYSSSQHARVPRTAHETGTQRQNAPYDMCVDGTDALTRQEVREEMKEDVAHHSSDCEAQQHSLERAAGLGGALGDEGQDQSRNGADEPGRDCRGLPRMLHVKSVFFVVMCSPAGLLQKHVDSAVRG